MSSSTDTTVTVDGVTLVVRIERKAVKHINARLRDGVLLVSAPVRVPQPTLDEAVAELARRLLRRQRAREVNAEEDALALAERVAARFPQPLQIAQVLFVTNQEARWGSYSPATRSIRLNAALRTMPRWVLEAVVAHELAHAIHPDHSPLFWALLRSVAPDTDRADAFLQGAIWLARRWDDLPPVERAILTREQREC